MRIMSRLLCPIHRGSQGKAILSECGRVDENGSGMGYRRILLVDNYDSYTWNLFQQLWKMSGSQPEVVRNDETTAADLLRRGFTHLVISPGPGRPEREEDFGLCADLLK